MKEVILSLLVVPLLLITMSSMAAEVGNSEAPVAAQSPDLPYDSQRAVLSFSKTVHGGVQHLVAKSPDDSEQIKRIQDYLVKLVSEFRKGDFSETERLHGAGTPGLVQLKEAKSGDVSYEYEPFLNGGQIHFSSEYPKYVQALHEWFDVQMKEHGNAVVPEHQQHHRSASE